MTLLDGTCSISSYYKVIIQVHADLNVGRQKNNDNMDSNSPVVLEGLLVQARQCCQEDPNEDDKPQLPSLSTTKQIAPQDYNTKLIA